MLFTVAKINISVTTNDICESKYEPNVQVFRFKKNYAGQHIVSLVDTWQKLVAHMTLIQHHLIMLQ